MKFPTHAVLGVTTGRLLGDISGWYKIVSFLIGRSAFTHELALYGRRAGTAIRAALPDLPDEKAAHDLNGANYGEYLARWEKQFGAEIALPDSLRDCLADEKNAIETATEMVGKDRVLAIKV